MNAIALTAAETAELASCETVIEHGLKVFHAVGLALLTIREKRLYRASFANFEDYCQAKWGFTDNYALRLMRGAEVVNNLAETPAIVGGLPDATLPMGRVLPTSERQVRPLIGLTPDQQREAWQSAVESAPGGKVTGAHVERIAQPYKPTNSHRSGVRADGDGAEPDLDENGQPLRRWYEDAEDEEALRAGDTVQYGGQRFTLRSVASSGRVYFDVPKSHKLHGRGIDSEDVLLLERAADRRAAAATADDVEAMVVIDGVPIAQTHPVGWKHLFLDDQWVTCAACGKSSGKWSAVRGGDWRCEGCKALTADGALLLALKEGTINGVVYVDGEAIFRSHPVGFEGLYATPEAQGYGRATCSACGVLHNAWKPVRAGQWKCQKCGETTNDDAMDIRGKDEFELEQRIGRHKPKTNYAAPATGSDQRDQCQTPGYAIDPLLPYLSPRSCVWEPAYGEGLLTEALYDSGFKTVITGDIQTGEDFFGYTPDAWDVIVTNPPFSGKYRWLERCYALEKPFALLMPLEVLGAKSAQVLFREHGINVIFLSDRVDFKMPNLGWDGGGAQFPVAWFCWGLPVPEQMVFADIEEAKRAFKDELRGAVS